ncbi:MAG: hypothetical protein KJ583_02200, partial [Nanoarchaeota archaeon]|nr:hypothetical protein [Nanoarchaeota archaeon]MBU1604106.1 hypothetical protein [Nanoarchaeota archaeon]
VYFAPLKDNIWTYLFKEFCYFLERELPTIYSKKSFKIINSDKKKRTFESIKAALNNCTNADEYLQIHNHLLSRVDTKTENLKRMFNLDEDLGSIFCFDEYFQAEENPSIFSLKKELLKNACLSILADFYEKLSDENRRERKKLADFYENLSDENRRERKKLADFYEKLSDEHEEKKIINVLKSINYENVPFDFKTTVSQFICKDCGEDIFELIVYDWSHNFVLELIDYSLNPDELKTEDFLNEPTDIIRLISFALYSKQYLIGGKK